MRNSRDDSFAKLFDAKARKSARQAIPVFVIAAALGPLVCHVSVGRFWNRFVAGWIAVCVFVIGILLLFGLSTFGSVYLRFFEKFVGGTDRTDHPGRWVP